MLQNYEGPEAEYSEKGTKKDVGVYVWILFFIVMLGTGFGLFQYHAETKVKVSDTVTVNESFIVEARNIDPIKIADNELLYGTECMIGEGGTITVLGMSEGYILAEYSYVPGEVVEYRHASHYYFFGSCPNHTPFFITTEKLSAMKKAKEQKLVKIASEKKEMAIVRQILAGKKHR